MKAYQRRKYGKEWRLKGKGSFERGANEKSKVKRERQPSDSWNKLLLISHNFMLIVFPFQCVGESVTLWTFSPFLIVLFIFI